MEIVHILLLCAVAALLITSCCVLILTVTAVLLAAKWLRSNRPEYSVSVTATGGGGAGGSGMTGLVATVENAEKQAVAKKQAGTKRKTVKCPRCQKFTELGTPIREETDGNSLRVIYACQHCQNEIG